MPRETIRLLVALLFLSYCNGVVKKLSDVSYRLTPCGSAGRSGPSFQQCKEHYTSVKSAVASALRSNPEQQDFFGGQGFTFPGSGWYNVTVAGASGGRGLCNIWEGLGAVFRGRLYVEKGVNDTVMVVVGQRGKGPCDVGNATLVPDLCATPPTTESEAAACCQEWTACDNSADYGGGGGGGASMIWAPDPATGQYSQSTLPMVIAGGGGGTGIRLNYTAFATGDTIFLSEPMLQQIKSSPNQTDRDFFIEFINAKEEEVFGVFETFAGQVGTRPNDHQISSGAGSGWIYNTQEGVSLVDGSLLSVGGEDFSRGGYDCVSASISPSSSVTDGEPGNRPPLSTGGYGGGGGGCGGGGGGGGYTGGSVIGTGSFVPGSGGFSLVRGPVNGGFETGAAPPGDGYVEIVPDNCMCTGQCHIVTEGYFECTCEGPSVVAPDGLDCIVESVLDLLPGDPPGLRSVVGDGGGARGRLGVSLHRLAGPAARLYSVSASLLAGSTSRRRRSGTDSDGSSCAIMWLGSQSQPILASDPVHGLPGQTHLLRRIQSMSLSPAVEEVTQGEVVTAALVITDSTSCTVGKVVANISVVTPEINASALNLTEFLELYNDSLITLANQILGSLPISTSSLNSSSTATPSSFASPSTPLVVAETPLSPPSTKSAASPTGSPTSSSSSSIVVGVVVGVALVVVGVVALGLLISIERIYRKRHKLVLSGHDDLTWSRGRNGGAFPGRFTQKGMASSLRSNPAYNEIVAFSSQDINGPVKNGGPMRNHAYRLDSGVGSEADAFAGLDEESEEDEVWRPATRHGRRQTFSFTPKFGVMAPSVNFSIYNKSRDANDWGYDRTQLTFLREVGEGQFGKVLLMQAKGIAGHDGRIPVAVKTLSSTEEQDIKLFLEEIDLMKRFCHSNIVSLLGVDCDYEAGAPLMILEYMPYGDLRSFLVKYRPSSKGGNALISTNHQMGFARDIANALAFLHTSKYVHRDIAARNCLVGPRLEAKLADFGMARRVAEKDYYRLAGSAMLPVRWMAPESLLYGIYTTASDVWSYGVLLWEIAMYGQMPLENKSSEDIIKMAGENAMCLSWTNDYSPELQLLSMQCYQIDPNERPEIGEVVGRIPRTARRFTLTGSNNYGL